MSFRDFQKLLWRSASVAGIAPHATEMLLPHGAVKVCPNQDLCNGMCRCVKKAAQQDPLPVFASDLALEGPINVEAPAAGFTISKASLYPPEAEQGVWPLDYTLSDHALLTAVFTSRDLCIGA